MHEVGALGKRGKRAVTAGVGVNLRDLPIGLRFVQAAHLFRAVAVFTVGLAGVRVNGRGRQPHAELLGRDAHEKRRRGGLR